jgi:pimeloyl-ACP methyl ester carboxylesterase
MPVVIMVLMVLASTSLVNNASAYTTLKNSTTTVNASSSFLDNIQTKKVRVGDIDIAYKIFDKGKPLLFIPGFSMTMDGWDPIVLDKLSSNHTIIIFDNRGIGDTTAGTKAPSISQFANDTAGLIDVLEIKKPVDVLGLSMGGLIAQELVLLHPDIVDRLIIHASSCGGNESLPPQVGPEVLKSMVSGNASADTFLSTLFPKEWIQQHIDYIQKNFVFPMGKVSKESLLLQFEATSKWSGSCNRLPTIAKPTLAIVIYFIYTSISLIGYIIFVCYIMNDQPTIFGPEC